MAADIPIFTLNNGTKIPAVGLGCWIGSPGNGEIIRDMCQKAFNAGYRHVDTADMYGNEEEVGRAIKESGIARSEIYVTTKLNNTQHNTVREAFEESLKKIDCDYIDLYLMHWPQAVDPKTSRVLKPEEHPTIIDTWKEMEQLLDTGKVKSIGVSNFSIKTVEQLLLHCKVVPATNQVELHPCLPQHDLKAYCDSKGIVLTAYSPLGRSPTEVFVDEPDIQAITTKLNVTAAQVLISWSVQRGVIAVPRSTNEERIRANISLVKLSSEDMEVLNKLHSKPGMHRTMLAHNHKEDGTVFGWTYEELGWNMIKGGVVLNQRLS